MARREKEIQFARRVRAYGRASGRDTLPWRVSQTPYRVFVSEFMLQQTQVARVIPKFEAFVRRFPDFNSLSKATLPEVYKVWQGLGYNRRAKYMRDAARAVMLVWKGALPCRPDGLEQLPGIGPYTARAIATFAFGNPEPFIETNIRTALIHTFFSKRTGVTDAELVAILSRLSPTKGSEARKWYAALMDYGAYLKASGVKNNSKSKHYTKQSKFEGSLRQMRGAIMRELGKNPLNKEDLFIRIGSSQHRTQVALEALIKEGLLRKKGEYLYLSE